MITYIKTHSHINHLLFVVVFFTAISYSSVYSQQNFAANTSGYDTARIYHAMDKARNGGEITVAVIGGSITEGYAASSINSRWANLVTSWWSEKFPAADVNLINAGWGGTGSDIGTHRVQKDVLQYNPDFAVIEFSVNDSEGEKATKMMEGLSRQILADTSYPGVIMLLLMQENGTTAQASHKPVGNHYGIPMISFADLIEDQLIADGIPISDLYSDGIHPVDLGMQYIADFITGELDTIYNHLPASEDLPPIDTILPAPVITDIYQHTYMYDNNSLMYSSNSGWETSSTYWYGENVDDEITFSVEGNAVSVMYTRHNNKLRGQVEVWVDEGPKVTLDAYWEETWGPGTVLEVIEEGLADGLHTLHVKVVESTSPGATGHYFELHNVLKAGNIGDVAPVAIISEPLKYVTGDIVYVDGTLSNDPDGDSLISYVWSIESKPGSSTSDVLTNDTVVASFIPDLEGEYVVGLVVNNGTSNSIMATKTITVRGYNTNPVAMTGNDTTVATYKEFRLDGSHSYDDDGDELTYLWEIISAPEGYIQSFRYPDTYNPIFRPKQEGIYQISLVVNDGFTDSEANNISITAIENYTSLDKYSPTGLNLRVYPNPASEIIQVEYSLKSSGEVSISIYNILGIRLYNMMYEKVPQGTSRVEIPVKELNIIPGSYFLKLNTRDLEKTVNLVIH